MCHVQLAGRLHCFAAGDGKAGIDVKASRAESVVFPPAERSSSSEYQQLMDHITLSSYPHLHLLAYLRVILYFFLSFPLFISFISLSHSEQTLFSPNPFLPSLLCAYIPLTPKPSSAPLLCHTASSPSLSLSIEIGKAAREIFYAQPNDCSHSSVPTDNINQSF